MKDMMPLLASASMATAGLAGMAMSQAMDNTSW